MRIELRVKGSLISAVDMIDPGELEVHVYGGRLEHVRERGDTQTLAAISRGRPVPRPRPRRPRR